MALNHFYHIIFLLTLILISCGASDNVEDKAELPKTEYSLKLGDSIIQVDSVSAEVWYEEQVYKDIVTLKVYCFSGYPMDDETVLQKNKWMCIIAQCPAEKGSHYISSKGDEWVNALKYEFSHASVSAGRGVKKKITVTAIDQENDLISCQFKLGEYIEFKKSLKGAKTDVAVTFEGKNIPFKRFD